MEKIIALLLILLCMAGALAQPVHTYQTIPTDQARQIMDTAEDYILLDVRTQEEFNAQHIPGAVLLPYDEVLANAEAELPEKDALILVYCRSGRRSALAAQDLVSLGYTRVYDFGGIIDWPYETERGEMP